MPSCEKLGPLLLITVAKACALWAHTSTSRAERCPFSLLSSVASHSSHSFCRRKDLSRSARLNGSAFSEWARPRLMTGPRRENHRWGHGGTSGRPAIQHGMARSGTRTWRRIRRRRCPDREYRLNEGGAHIVRLACRHGVAYFSWCITFLSATDASDAAPWPSSWLLGMPTEPRRWSGCDVREAALRRRLDNSENCPLCSKGELVPVGQANSRPCVKRAFRAWPTPSKSNSTTGSAPWAMCSGAGARTIVR